MKKLLLLLFTLFSGFHLVAQCMYPNGTCTANDAITFLGCDNTSGRTIDVTNNLLLISNTNISGQAIALNNIDLTFSVANTITIDDCTMFSGDASSSVTYGLNVADGDGGTEYTFAELNTAIETCSCTTLAAAFAFLPVNLIDFTGKLSNDIATLNWSTASESSNEYFLVEHSFDGRTFTEVGRVEGQGSTAETTNYEWQQNAKKGVNYYRLTQFDFDGSSAVLGVVSLHNDTDSGLFVQPNPGVAGKEISLSISTNNQPELVQLVSISGQKWQLIWSENGTVQLPAHLSAGLYYLQVSSVGEHWAEPLMIIK